MCCARRRARTTCNGAARTRPHTRTPIHPYIHTQTRGGLSFRFTAQPHTHIHAHTHGPTSFSFLPPSSASTARSSALACESEGEGVGNDKGGGEKAPAACPAMQPMQRPCHGNTQRTERGEPRALVSVYWGNCTTVAVHSRTTHAHTHIHTHCCIAYTNARDAAPHLLGVQLQAPQRQLVTQRRGDLDGAAAGQVLGENGGVWAAGFHS